MGRFLGVILIVLSQSCQAQSLRQCYGHYLFFQSDSAVIKIADLGKGEYFQGFDQIDSNRVFYAYCFESEGEPSTALRMYDLRTGRTDALGQLDVTGDCWFTYSRDNGLVLLTWGDGIYTWDCVQRKKTKPKLLVTLPGCVFPFWVDSKTIGYTRCGITDRNPVFVHLAQ